MGAPDYVIDDEGKIPVEVRAQVRNISAIEENKHRFEMELYIQLCWSARISSSKIDLENEWRPNLEFLNVVNATERGGRLKILRRSDSRGVDDDEPVTIMAQSVSIRAVFSCHFVLQSFPCDTQTLTCNGIVWIPFKKFSLSQSRICPLERGRISFIVDESLSYLDVDKFTEKDAWEIEHRTHVTTGTTEKTAQSDDGNVFSTLSISVNIARRPQYYVWNIVLPVFAFVCITMLAIIIPPSKEQFHDRCTVTLTMLLTGVAFKFVVQDHLPKICYLTILDKYLVCSNVIMWLTVTSNALSCPLVDYYGVDVAILWDRISVGFLAVFWVVTTAMFMWFVTRGEQIAAREQHASERSHVPTSLLDSSSIAKVHPGKQDNVRTQEKCFETATPVHTINNAIT